MPTAPNVSVLLRLRWLQLRRALPGYGIVLLTAGVCGLLWLLHKAVTHDPSLAAYISGGMLLAVAGLHQRRQDHHFLQRHLPRPRLSMAVEYGAFMLPVSLVLMLAQAWLPAAALCLVLALPWSPVTRASGVRGAWLRKRIPVQLFEWRSAVQGTMPFSLLLWMGALAFCWLPVLPLFMLGAIAMLAAAAQEQCEPRAMLLATAPDARTLLRDKMLGSVWLMLLITTPVLIGATIFRPQWWWIHLFFGLGLLVLVAYAVVLKYANYRPNERLDANSANVGVATVFAVLPGLCVVPVIMLLTEVPKARANLNSYFDAHHP